MFYGNGDRYDGLWLDDKPHDEGRMIYSNGDVYEGNKDNLIFLEKSNNKCFKKITLQDSGLWVSAVAME